MSATVAAKAFLQLELLRRLQTKDAPVSKNALARELGKDLSNMRKTLDALEKDGLIEGLALTPMGERALLAADVAEGRSAASVGVLQISFLKLRPNPLNPRKTFDEASIEELAESIIGAGGILNPLLVFPADAGGVHTIAAGERRFRAVQKLIKMGLWDVDRPLPGLEQEDDPAQAALIGLIENGQREGLNLYDEALAFQALMTAKGCSARECARLIGKSARKVQEGVQVVRQAKTQDVDAFRAGEITWEELRTGVRKPSEAPRSPIAEAPAEVAQSAVSPLMPVQPSVQLDIEDAAPRRVELLPSQYLALLEISHLVVSKPEKKATDCQTARKRDPLWAPKRDPFFTVFERRGA
jgi:ParB/RepB/Spo0J family partition protein